MLKNNTFPVDAFDLATDNFSAADEIKRPSISYISDAWRRLKLNKLAMTGLVVIILLVIFVVFGPLATPHNYAYQDFSVMNQGPSANHWFGTDEMGRDLFARACQGGRVSLFIGLAAACIDLIAGVLIGGIAGYVGGQLDNLLMRFAEALYSIPYMLMVVLMAIIFGSGIFSLVLAITITGWVPMARLVRGQVLSLRELEYVQASRSMGAEDSWIFIKHIVPNAMGPIIVSATLTIPRAIFSEATLSFLGLGIQPPNPSWGQMASDAIEQMIVGNLNVILVPSILICLSMFSFNVLGDGLRDAFDPKMRK